MPDPFDLDAAAESAAEVARQSAESGDEQGDLLGMYNWFREKKGKSKPRRDDDDDDKPQQNFNSEGKFGMTRTAKKTIAEDGQSLGTQTPATQLMFRTKYGEEAEWRWVDEHNEELKANRLRYGTSEPPPGMPTAKPPTTAVPSTTAPASPASTPKTYTTASGQKTIFTPQPIATYNPEPPTTVPGAIPTTFGPASSAPQPPNTSPSPGVGTSSTTPPVSSTTPTAPAVKAPGPDDDIVVMSQQGREMTIKRAAHKKVGGYDPAYYPIVRDPVTEAWNNRSSTAERQSNIVPYDPKTGQAGEQLRFTPERNIVGYNPTTGETYELPASETVRESAKPASINIDYKPIDTLAELAVQKRGGGPEEAAAEQRRILQGIGSLIRGEKEGAWAEAHLNDIARIAWARQARANGETADPRNAPVEYIEAWKDAFYGSDASVPLVKELDQQMIDAAVSRTPTGTRVFDWRQAYGDPNETGNSSVISRQITSNDCGPNAFANVLRSRGYNLDPAQSYEYARKYQYHNGDEFSGPANFARMLRQEAGVDAKHLTGVDEKLIQQELDAGRPVTLSSRTHYWTLASYRDTERGREYYTGATGAVAGNPPWAKLSELTYAGASPSDTIIAQGDVDPGSRVVSTYGLRPPGAPNPSRANLSRQTQAALATGQQSSQRNAVPSTGTLNLRNVEQALPNVVPHVSLAQQMGTEENVDPNLILAVIDKESDGVTNARSGAGAGGLMQLMPPTARGLGVLDVDDPVQNVKGGAKYLRQLLDMFDGDLDLALAAYNAGPGAVMSYNGIPPYEETQQYVRDVKARYERLRNASVPSLR